MIPTQGIAEGDCLRSATASILEMNPRRVPHFIKRPGFWRDVWTEWLEGRGWSVRQVSIKTLRTDAPRGFWIAITAPEPDKPWTHAVVMRGERVAHDVMEDPPRRRRYLHGYVLEPLVASD